MFDLCAYGDVLIDMFHDGASPNGFQANCGGTVANMVVAASRLGVRAALVSKIGDDVMGDRLERSFREQGVDIRGLLRDPRYFTTMTFVELSPEGERSFSFARQFGADAMLYPEELPMDVIRDCRIFHYSGMALNQEPSRSTTLALLRQLRQEGRYICTDVSYRHNLWEDAETAVRVTREALRYTDLYKSSDDEALLISGCDNLPDAAAFFADMGCSLCLITCGERGSFYYLDGQYGMVPSFPVRVVDTTGAGDAFFGGFLSQLLKREDPRSITAAELPEMLRYGNAVGALTTTKMGGLDGLPTKEQVDALVKVES